MILRVKNRLHEKPWNYQPSMLDNTTFLPVTPIVKLSTKKIQMSIDAAKERKRKSAEKTIAHMRSINVRARNSTYLVNSQLVEVTKPVTQTIDAMSSGYGNLFDKFDRRGSPCKQYMTQT